MKNCNFYPQCGGCSCRELEETEYKNKKIKDFDGFLAGINQTDIKTGAPVFIEDNSRRRASFTFAAKKGVVSLGFNQAKSNEIIDLRECNLLTPRLNANLENLAQLIKELSLIKVQEKIKGKKFVTKNIYQGDVWACDAQNGLDIVLEFDFELNYEHRSTIFEFLHANNDFIRISHRKASNFEAETIVEKVKPIIKIADYDIFIPAGTFLQPSQAGQEALINLVMKYLGNDSGKIADLFCGVGTFSYPLAKNINNKITAIDSSKSLLEGFRLSVNKNMIPNIEIKEKNLFKYPLDEKELKDFSIVVLDPPRAGASTQVAQLVKAPNIQKVIYVSCNPSSFVKDANQLIANGFVIKEATLVDQFIYSNHNELVAVFEK